MGLNENIKTKRIEKRMTLEKLANQVGVSRQTIQRYESGVITNIPSEKIELIAKALDVTPGYLMGWEDEKIVFRYEISNDNKHYETQKRLLKYFENLNSIGKEEAVKRLEELTYLPKYTENQ